jgi:hypothetical protein
MQQRQSSQYRGARSLVLAAACMMVGLAARCGDKTQQSQSQLGSAEQLAAQSESSAPVADASTPEEDPCRYVTASEVEPYTGPLVAPPYRAGANDALPNRAGDACLYRGKDGREVMVQYSAHGGATAGTAARRVPAVMDRMLHNASGDAQQGTGDDGGGMAQKVMGSAGPGPWDNSNWFPQGQLIVFKGDQMISVNIIAANGGKDGAMDLAKKAVERLPHPLDYDGAKAVAAAPAPVKRVPACDLIPRAKAEAILGSLKGDPTPDSTDTSCTYKVASADGDVSYTMGISWTGGYGGLNMMKRGGAMVAGPLGAASMSKTLGAGRTGVGTFDSAQLVPKTAMPKLDDKSQKILNGFTKGLGMPGMGAAVGRGLAPDTMLVGPWDSAALVNGSWLLASKDDVGLMMILGTADYDKAKALIAAACEKL